MDQDSPKVIRLVDSRPQNGGGSPPTPPPALGLQSIQTFGPLLVFNFHSEQEQQSLAFDPKNIVFLQEVRESSSGDQELNRRRTLLLMRSSEPGQVISLMIPLGMQDLLKVVSDLDIGMPLETKKEFP